MASSVALPLEKQFTSIRSHQHQLDQFTGRDRHHPAVRLEPEHRRGSAGRAVDDRAASRQLPPQMPAPPSFQKVNPNDQSIFFIILRSSTLPLSTLDEIAQSVVAQRISMVSGVA
jgi:HAE1 family hydrophobic/amphiphilic exporter-1